MKRLLVLFLVLLSLDACGQVKRSSRRVMGSGVGRVASGTVMLPPSVMTQFWNSLDSSRKRTSKILLLGDSHSENWTTWSGQMMDSLKVRYLDGGSGYMAMSLGAANQKTATFTQANNGWVSYRRYGTGIDGESYYVNVNNSTQFNAKGGDAAKGFSPVASASSDTSAFVWGGTYVSFRCCQYGQLRQDVTLKPSTTYNYTATIRSDSATGNAPSFRIYCATDGGYKVNVSIPASRLTDSTTNGQFTTGANGGVYTMWVMSTSNNALLCKLTLSAFNIREVVSSDYSLLESGYGIGHARLASIATSNYFSVSNISGKNLHFGNIRRTNGGQYTRVLVDTDTLRINNVAASDTRADTVKVLATSGTHSLVFYNDANSSPFFTNIGCYADSGIVIDNLSHGGWNASVYLTVDSTQFYRSLVPFSSDLAIIMLGTNTVSSVASFKTEMVSLIGRVKAALPSASVVVISPVDNGLVRSYTMLDIANACRDAAVQTGVGFINLYALFGSYTDNNNAGLMLNTFHPNTAGHAKINSILRPLFRGTH